MSEKQALILSRWDGGENTEDSSDSLQANESPEMENVNFGRGGSIRKDDGIVELGVDSEDGQISKLIKTPNRNGENWLFKFVDTKLKIFDSVNDVWSTIKTGLTAGEKWGDDTRNNVTIFCSQVDTAMALDLGKITRLDGSILDNAATIDLVDASQISSTGTIYINNTSVTFTGKTSNQLTGCTGAVATADGYLAVEALTDKSGIPKGNMCIDFGGRLIIAGVLTSGGATLYGSKASDRTNFAIAGGGAADDAFAEVLKSKINSIRVFFNDNLEERIIAFCGDNNIYTVNVSDDAALGTLVQTSTIPFKQNVTAINHFSTLVTPNDIIHIDLDNQIRTLGPRSNDGSGIRFSDSISGKRKSDFRDNYDFSDAAGAVVGDEYWLNCKKGGGDYNNKFLVYDLAKSAWRSRTGISASDVIEFNNKVTISDSILNKVYQITPNILNDGENDDANIPLYFKYATPDIDNVPMVFERLQYVKIIGIMSSAADLKLNVFRDFGNIQIGKFTLLGSNENIIGSIMGQSSGGSFGTVAFGTEPFGTSSGEDRRFFIAMLSMESMPDLENFRIVFENEQADVYIEIFKVKPIYGQVMKENYIPANYIIKNNN